MKPKTRPLTPLQLAALLALLGGCASAPTPAQSQAVQSEGEEQAACVARFNTKTEIDACRNDVRTKHGRAPR